MQYALQWLRSLIFIVLLYGGLLVIGIVFMPLAIFSQEWTYRTVHMFTGWVRWIAKWLIGLHSEIRGNPPTDEVLIAAKHQSFFDIIMIVDVTPRPRFIMKSSLKSAPVLGWYAKKMGCIAVDRGKRAAAIAQLKEGVANNLAGPGQLIIYPQGTRVAPGAEKPYKIGTGVLYEQLAQDCVPAATNVGVFWPRTGVYRKPGTAVIEFLPRVSAGLSVKKFMKTLEEQIETASDRLMSEAGFDGEKSDEIH